MSTRRADIVFVTGSDTGVGKTAVTLLLGSALLRRGKQVRTLKPVETGCIRRNGELVASDAALLAHLHPAEKDNIIYKFEKPLAPSLAAAAEGRSISGEVLEQSVRDAADKADILLVEGAGGLLVPYLPSYTFADLAARTGAHLLVVVGSRLGAINHALLTFEVIRKRALPVLGYVLNDLFREKGYSGIDDDMKPALEANREALAVAAADYGVRELAFVPCLGRAFTLEQAESVPEAAEQQERLAEAVIAHFAK